MRDAVEVQVLIGDRDIGELASRLAKLFCDAHNFDFGDQDKNCILDNVEQLTPSVPSYYKPTRLYNLHYAIGNDTLTFTGKIKTGVLRDDAFVKAVDQFLGEYAEAAKR